MCGPGARVASVWRGTGSTARDRGERTALDLGPCTVHPARASVSGGQVAWLGRRRQVWCRSLAGSLRPVPSRVVSWGSGRGLKGGGAARGAGWFRGWRGTLRARYHCCYARGAWASVEHTLFQNFRGFHNILEHVPVHPPMKPTKESNLYTKILFFAHTDTF
jgi:hypothetical protein